MANWCTNFVTFQGNETQLKKIDELFNSLILQEKETNNGQLPDGIKGTTYFFYTYKNDLGIYSFETKWVPPIEELTQIADQYGLDFECSSEEMGSLIYGTVFYTNKTLLEVYLENEELDAYDYDEDKDVYTFEGKEYESSHIILEELLDRKKAKYSSSLT